MGALSPLHWLVLLWPLSFFALPVIPAWRILGRLGFSPAWALLYFIPGLGLIGLFVLAWARWPREVDATQGP
ncbi:MAG: hypothetical protein JWM33_230 [Caulobacteraceae bacterium]|nr:hypothetical protein [Caulobacteraceae bacterium]